VFELSNIRNLMSSESIVSQLSDLGFAKMQYFIMRNISNFTTKSQICYKLSDSLCNVTLLLHS